MTNNVVEKLQQLDAFWQQQVRVETFTAEDKVTLYYMQAVPDNYKGTIVIANGRIESFLKYQEVVHDLFQQGYAVFSLDHRGQGLSQRLCDNRHKGYVHSFDDYVKDLHQLVTTIVKPNTTGKYYLLCHSMGSAIGALYQLAHPEQFNKIVFCSPMFGIATALNKTFAYWLINKLAQVNDKCSQQPWYFFGQGNYIPVPYQLNQITHCKYRYRWFKTLYQQQSQLQLGGVTVAWLKAAVDAMEYIKLNAAKITVPCLLLQAEKDLIVDNNEQDIIYAALPNAEKFLSDGAKHEILMETDERRAAAMDIIIQFIQE